MRDDAARRERARVAGRDPADAPPGPAALAREVAALRAEVALLRAGHDCGAGPRLRATPSGNGAATLCCACQLARAAHTIGDLRDAARGARARARSRDRQEKGGDGGAGRVGPDRLHRLGAFGA